MFSLPLTLRPYPPSAITMSNLIWPAISKISCDCCRVLILSNVSLGGIKVKGHILYPAYCQSPRRCRVSVQPPLFEQMRCEKVSFPTLSAHFATYLIYRVNGKVSKPWRQIQAYTGAPFDIQATDSEVLILQGLCKGPQ